MKTIARVHLFSPSGVNDGIMRLEPIGLSEMPYKRSIVSKGVSESLGIEEGKVYEFEYNVIKDENSPYEFQVKFKSAKLIT